MQGFNQVLIGGYPSGGLVTEKKPMMLPNEAFSKLRNAYVFRDRVKKRDGSVNIGRLSRNLSSVSIGTSTNPDFNFNIFSIVSPPIIEPFAQIVPGSVIINIGTLKLKDNGMGVLVQRGNITGLTNANPGVVTSNNHNLSSGSQVSMSGVGGMTDLINGPVFIISVVDVNRFSLGIDTTNTSLYGIYTTGGTWTSINTSNFGTINYATGTVTITTTIAGGTAATITFSYYPALPVMGILKRDIATVGIDQTVYFDTTYAYQFDAGIFHELVAGTVWTGTNTDFFWAANYQGANPSLKYFFETNFNLNKAANTYDPIRFYNNTAWTNLQPLLTATTTLWQALIIIPYYGRLLTLNTWEGATADTFIGASNFTSRCTFSQIGDPTDQTNGWRRDIFGTGGFIDAPTNEAIISAAFFRNTLIVFFEYSTWQLRYVGEYGFPFIFERISSDFGAVSTYSSIVFDQGVMTVSDRGVIQASAGGLKRLDEQIPETIFGFQIQNNAPNFVHGIRDFEKEVVYWNYLDVSNQVIFQTYPNTVLLFNYRNNTWAQFRDTITCFGRAQFQLGITWDSLTTFWDSNVSWDNVDDQNYAEYVTMGNQQGFISVYENPDAETAIPSPIMYGPSLFIYSIDLTTTPVQLVSPAHNLESVNEEGQGELIYLSSTLWSGTDPGINDVIYQAYIIDANTIGLRFWNGENYVDLISTSTSIYIGNGVMSLLPVMDIEGKDFNPYQAAGKQYKVSYIDFLMDTNNHYPTIPAVTIQLFVNSYLVQANQITFGNQELSNSSLKSGFIQGAISTNPCIITSKNHSLRTGTLIYISNIIGMTNINQLEFNITVIDANTFSINSTSVSGTYAGGGIWNTVNAVGPTYLQGTDYAWYRFYSNQFGQFLRVGMTFDDALMNQISTHQTPLVLHAMNFYFREGGRIVN
jgi:hypothetical protein